MWYRWGNFLISCESWCSIAGPLYDKQEQGAGLILEVGHEEAKQELRFHISVLTLACQERLGTYGQHTSEDSFTDRMFWKHRNM